MNVAFAKKPVQNAAKVNRMVYARLGAKSFVVPSATTEAESRPSEPTEVKKKKKRGLCSKPLKPVKSSLPVIGGNFGRMVGAEPVAKGSARESSQRFARRGARSFGIVAKVNTGRVAMGFGATACGINSGFSDGRPPPCKRWDANWRGKAGAIAGPRRFGNLSNRPGQGSVQKDFPCLGRGSVLPRDGGVLPPPKGYLAFIPVKNLLVLLSNV